MHTRPTEAGTPPTRAGASRRTPRMRKRLVAASIPLAALLIGAPAALADTTVSIENGQFGTALSGRHVFIRDSVSFPFDMKMAVTATRSGGDIVVSDLVGEVHAQGICDEHGNTVRCPDTDVVGLRVEGGNKNDVLTNGTDLVGVLIGSKGDDILQGGPNDDQLNGQDGDDKEFGGDGDDLFVAEPGADRLDGEDGAADNGNYAAATGAVSIQLDDSDANDGVSGEHDRLLGIESARGSKFGDDIDGSVEPNTLSGLGGNDTINGRAGDDRMFGATGADVLDGDEDNDTAFYTDHTAGVVVDIDGNPDDGNAEDGPAGARDNVDPQTENLVGSSADDNLIGHPGLGVANTLDGRDGDDTLQGREGDDELVGNIGDDRLLGSAGADTLLGGEGDDEHAGGPDADVLDGGPNGALGDLMDYSVRIEVVTVTLDSAVAGDDGDSSDGPAGQRDDVRAMERVVTGSGDDVVTGADSGESIQTGAGEDTLIGNGGGDTLVGGPDKDGYSGGLGADKLNTDDDEVDEPVSCGEDPEPDQSVDEIIADLVDRDANPEIATECEVGTFNTP